MLRLPFGKKNFFFNQWNQLESSYHRVEFQKKLRDGSEPAANSLNQPLLSRPVPPFSNFKGDENYAWIPLHAQYMYCRTATERESEFHERSIAIVVREKTLETHEGGSRGESSGFEFLRIGRKLVDDRLPVNNVTSFRAGRYEWWNRGLGRRGEASNLHAQIIRNNAGKSVSRVNT